MPKWIALCLIPLLASCATCRQDSDREKLLYENDMLQAKLIIVANDRDRLPLAQALLERAARDDRSGEADFYQAVLIARRDGQASDCERITRLLERSAERGYPLANAMLYKIYAEPFLLPRADIPKAETYRQAYAELPVARSGYPPSSEPGRWSIACSRRLRPDPSGPNPGPATRTGRSAKASFLSIVNSAKIRYPIEFFSAILCPSEVSITEAAMKRRSPRHYARNTALATLGLYAILMLVVLSLVAGAESARNATPDNDTATTFSNQIGQALPGLLSGLNSRRAG